jgi:RNA polymerase sigma-70 factor (ECF subfamily)
MSDIVQGSLIFMQKSKGRQSVQGAAVHSEHDYLLVERIAGGDERALEIVFSRYGDRLYSYICGLIPDESTAQDILQETMITIWEKAGNYRGEGRVIAWMFGIARNKAMRSFRKKRELLINEQAADLPQNNRDGPEKKINLRQRNESLRAGLKALSPKHREVLNLFFLHGMNQSEVAQICNIPVGTVKSRLNQARKDLKNVLVRQGLSFEDLI